LRQIKDIMDSKIIRYTLLVILIVLLPLKADAQLEYQDEDDYYDEKYGEIDNFDFLYPNVTDDLNGGILMVGNLLDEAFRHIGDRYRSGASGPHAFDCSGFTSYCFAKVNIRLRRSSREQYQQGVPITKGQLQSGDLVFFNGWGRGRGIGHVGIVVEVDGATKSFSFIHAASKGITVSDSRDPYYASRYVGARRVR